MHVQLYKRNESKLPDLKKANVCFKHFFQNKHQQHALER